MIINNRNQQKSKSNELPINDNIRAREVLVITDSGEQLGVLNINKALDLAYGKELDLVCVAPQGKPPVCKIMDYKKYRFEQQKKQKAAKKNQTVSQIKEIRLSPTIDIGDFNTKLKRGTKFLEAGDKLKLSIRFRGRMIVHKDLGRQVLERYAEGVKEIATVTQRAKMDGRNMFMVLEPNKK
ncbi:translation initiation factor IF-3 [Mycoplasmatota bacterium WC44]